MFSWIQGKSCIVWREAQPSLVSQFSYYRGNLLSLEVPQTRGHHLKDEPPMASTKSEAEPKAEPKAQPAAGGASDAEVKARHKG